MALRCPLQRNNPKAFPRGEGGPKGRMRDGVQSQQCIRSDRCTTRQISARYPHQSKINSEEMIFASFPPGEALGAPAPLHLSHLSAVFRIILPHFVILDKEDTSCYSLGELNRIFRAG